MPEIETTTTHVGEVSFETETCEHCRNKMKADQAIKIHVDPYWTTCSATMICDEQHAKPNEEAYLCEYCAESIFGYSRGFADKDWVQEPVSRIKDLDIEDVFMIMMVALPVAMILTVIL